MRSIWGTILISAAMAAGTAQAADLAASYERVPARERIVVYPTDRVGLIPGCVDIRSHLLRCAPRINISPDEPGVAQVIDGPPARIRRPYPEVFFW